MKYVRLAALLVATLMVDVAAQTTPDGRWRAVPADGVGASTVWNEVILVLKADGTKLTGTADIGHTALARWPGVALIQNGTVDGNAFSFDWWGTPTASFGTVTFTGTVDGDRMNLTMSTASRKYGMKVERLPSQ